MDLRLSSEQEAIAAALNGIWQRHEPTRHESRPRSADQDLLKSLAAGGFLDLVAEASPLDACLLVESAAQAAVSGPIAARGFVAPLLGIVNLPLNVALAESSSGALVRYGPDLDLLIAVDGDRVVAAEREACTIEPVQTRYGFPYARITINESKILDASPEQLRTGWRIALAAELSGAALGAIKHTAAYVSGRYQFGRPIGSFQAVQHRLATAYVMAEGSRWLTRRAASTPDDPYLASAAAAFACAAAAETYTATHQVSGGAGATSEHGLVRWTMRLVSLQQELGGQRGHNREVMTTRSTSANAELRFAGPHRA